MLFHKYQSIGNFSSAERLTRRFRMHKKYIVRLTDEERQTCMEVVKKLKERHVAAKCVALKSC